MLFGKVLGTCVEVFLELSWDGLRQFSEGSWR